MNKSLIKNIIILIVTANISWAQTTIPIGDTLTVIQRPLINIPAIVQPGDTLNIECDAGGQTSGWAAKLMYDQTQIPLQVLSSSYDPATLWWSISTLIPNVQIYELYDLVVTANGGIEDTARNAVRIISEFKDNYYFVHITDTHLPTHLYVNDPGSATDTSEMLDLHEVIRDINIINPEFVLITGDLVNEGELEDYLGRRYYTKAQRIFSAFKVPLYLSSGNHDLGGWDSTPPPDGTARRDWWRFFGWKRLNVPPAGAPWHTQNYSFDYGPVHFIGLEAYINYDNWRWSTYGNTSFTSGQMQWLNNNLAAAAGSSTRILFYHYDFSSQINLNTLGVDMALWGHIHNDNGSITTPPYNLSTNNVCDNERSYRIIRVSNGVLQPLATISAGDPGDNLKVDYQPANNGMHYTVTAQITNNFNIQFKHAQLRFLMPKNGSNPQVQGGTLFQIENFGSNAVYYINVDILQNSTQTVTVSVYSPGSGPFAQNTVINSHYQSPLTDTLNIVTEIINPDSHNVHIESIIETFDQSEADTIIMFDDGAHNDSNAGDGFYGGFWPVTVDERNYNVHVTTFSVDSGFYNVLSNAAYFTTIGPVRFDSSYIAQHIGNLYRVRLILKNESSIASASNINVELSTSDTNITIEENYRYFGNIAPGQTAQSNSFYNFITQIPRDSMIVNIKVFSNDKFFWGDSFTFTFVPTGISTLNNDIPFEFTLQQNYPNPFNNSTTIEFSIPKTEIVSLKIYNLLGQEVVNVFEKQCSPGNYRYIWDASGFASGIYYCKIEAGEFALKRKMILMK
jgi:3',5'-cyclic AMP phosphodiesterase CpdA